MTAKINPIKSKPILRIYRTDGAQPGWEKRLDSIGSGTYLLHEEMDYSRNRTIRKMGCDTLLRAKHRKKVKCCLTVGE